MNDKVVVRQCPACNAKRSVPVVLTIPAGEYTGEEKCKDCGEPLKEVPEAWL